MREYVMTVGIFGVDLGVDGLNAMRTAVEETVALHLEDGKSVTVAASTAPGTPRDGWTAFSPGQPHPTGPTRVRVRLSQPGLENEGEAGSFNWDIDDIDDMGGRIVAYAVVAPASELTITLKTDAALDNDASSWFGDIVAAAIDDHTMGVLEESEENGESVVIGDLVPKAVPATPRRAEHLTEDEINALVGEITGLGPRAFATDFAVGMPILEQAGISFRRVHGVWNAMSERDSGTGEKVAWHRGTVDGGKRYGAYSYQVHKRVQRFSGPTMLLAGFRCFVAMSGVEGIDIHESAE